jgi:hypothetical protein
MKMEAFSKNIGVFPNSLGARDSVVVRAGRSPVRYPMKRFFKIYLILPVALGPGIYSASSRNEYQKHKNNNVSGE